MDGQMTLNTTALEEQPEAVSPPISQDMNTTEPPVQEDSVTDIQQEQPIQQEETAPDPAQPEQQVYTTPSQRYERQFRDEAKYDEVTNASPAVNEELKSLSMAEYKDFMDAASSNQPLPDELAAKIPTFNKLYRKRLIDMGIEKQPWNTWDEITEIPKAGAVGFAKGILNTANFVTELFSIASAYTPSWVDENVPASIKQYYERDEDGIKEANAFKAAKDDLVARMNGWLNSQVDENSLAGNIVLPLAETAAGIAAGSGISKRVLGAMMPTANAAVVAGTATKAQQYTVKAIDYLLRDTIAGTAAFELDDKNFGDVLKQIGAPDLLTACLIVDENDSDGMKMLKQMGANMVGDVAMNSLLSAVGHLRKAFKGTKGEILYNGYAELMKGDPDVQLGKLTSIFDDTDWTQTLDELLNDPKVNRAELEEAVRTFGQLADDIMNGVIQPKSATELAEAVTDTVRKSAPDAVTSTAPKTAADIPADAVAPAPSFETATPEMLKEIQDKAADMVKNGGDIPRTKHTAFNEYHSLWNMALREENGAEKMFHLFLEKAADAVPERMEATYARSLSAMTDMTGFVLSVEQMKQAGQGMNAAIPVMQGMFYDAGKRIAALVKCFDDPANALIHADLETELKSVMKNAYWLGHTIDDIGTSLGRGLKSFQYIGMAKAIADDPNIAKAQERLARGLSAIENADFPHLVGYAREMSMLKKPKDMVRGMLCLSDTNATKALKSLTEYRINNMLSGIKTNMRNFIGNTVNYAYQNATDWVSGRFFGDTDALARTRHFWSANAASLRESMQMCIESFRRGGAILDADHGILEKQMGAISSTYWNAKGGLQWLNSVADTVGPVIRLPSRFLQAGDEFFKQLSYRSTARSQLMYEYEQAMLQNGVRPLWRDTVKFAEDNLNRFFTDAVDANGEIIVKNAVAAVTDDPKLAQQITQSLTAAARNTFTLDPAKGGFIESMGKLRSKHESMKFLLPFFNVPANILDETLRSNIFTANFSKRYRDAILAGGNDAARARAQAALGTSAAFGIAALWHEGMITGAAPRDKASREAWEAKGYRPNSIIFETPDGIKAVSYSALEPLSSLLGCVSDICQLTAAMRGNDPFRQDFRQDDADEDTLNQLGTAAAGMVSMVASNFFSKTYTKSILDALEIINTGDLRKFEQFAASWASGIAVPFTGLAGNIAQAFDPEYKETRGVIDRIMSKVPAFSDDYPARYSWITGQPKVAMGGMYSAGFNPLPSDFTPSDSTMKMLPNIADYLTQPTDRINGQRLTGAQLSDYYRLHGSVKLRGRTMLQALDDYCRKHPTVQGDELKKEIRDIQNEYRDAAKAELAKKYPELAPAKKQSKTLSSYEKAMGFKQPRRPRSQQKKQSVMDAIVKI